ncbi:MAG TPA: hypothetical protein DGG94_17885, partial [Micromonosporaceae bacterium]|nr:hypothetical protein [Micromonosporaceae bacterium]
SSLLSMLAIAALGVTRLVHTALVARNTDKTTVALVGTLIGATMMAGLFLPGGLSSAASKFIPYHLGRGNVAAAQAVYRLLGWVGYLCSGLLGLIVGGGALIYGLPVSDAVSVGLLTTAFSIYSIEKSALYGFHRVEAYVRLELIGSALAIAATLVVVLGGWHAYLLPLTLGYSVLILGAWVILRRSGSRGDGFIEHAEKREMAGYVGLASIGGLASAGLLQALPILADIYTSKAEVAYFVTAVSLVAPLYFLPRALGMALFPAMANAHGAGDMEAVRRHADLSTRGLFVLLGPLFVTAMLLARPVLVVIFGADFAAGAIVLQVLLAATYLMVTQVAAVNALSSGSPREVRIPVFAAVTGWLAGVAAAIPLGLSLGGAGVALAYLVAAAVSATGPLTAVARRHQLAWRGPIGRAVGAIVGALVIGWVVEMIPVSGGARWVVDVAVALVAGALAALILRRDIRDVIGGRRWRRTGSGEVQV